MFFAFYILVLINYVAVSRSFVLKRVSQGVTRNINHNDNRILLQDVRNNPYSVTSLKSLFETAKNLTNSRSPNLKLNVFDKRLSDEILSIKQNIYDRDALTSRNHKSTRNNVPTPTLEVKQKWPMVEILSEQDKFEEKPSNTEDTDLRYLLRDHGVDLTTTGTPVNIESNDAEVPHNRSKNKVEDLRSLADIAPSAISSQHKGVSSHHGCACSRRTNIWNFHNDDSCSCKTGADSHNCADCTKTTISYTVMPFYFTYDPYFYNPPHIVHIDKDKKRHKHDHDDYESDDSEEEYEYYTEPKKEKHRHTTKERKNNRRPKLQWDTEIVEEHPHQLVEDLIGDLTRRRPDTLIKTCHCSSLSNNLCSTRFLLPLVLLLIFI